MSDQALIPGPQPQSSINGPRTSLDRVMQAFEARGLAVRAARTNSFMASCPVHDDASPSLHVTWRRGHQGGAVLLYCHGCQAGTADIVEALGLTMGNLFDEPLPDRGERFGRIGKSPARRLAGRRRGKLGRLPAPITEPAAPATDEAHEWVEVARYPYIDHSERLVQEVIREECTAEGLRHKQFRQLFVTREGRRVKRKPPEFYPVLYRAPRVVDAARNGTEIWLLEGEKDVETAEALGLVATTNTQGGKSFPEELAEEFRGAGVAVVLDRDATGWARGVDLHTKLTRVDAQVRLLLPMVDRAKADFTDHVDAGFGVDDFLDLSVAEAAAWSALSSALAATHAKAKAIITAVDEARARWELAGSENPEENKRFAKRWVLESQIRQEALHDLVGQVYGHAAQAGTAWAAEATTEADALLTECTDAARRCHHDLGVPVPPSLLTPKTPTAQDAPAPTDPRETGEEEWVAGPGVRTTQPVFRVLDGKIVQWEANRSTRSHDDGDHEEAGKFKALLSMVVRVTAREYLEVDVDQDVEHIELLGRASTGRRKVAAPRSLVAVRLQYAESTGELMEIRVMADQWRDHSWLESLPGPPDYDHKRTGLETLQRAILAVSDNVTDEVLYRSTGWRENADGTHRYVHARGAITIHGHQDAPAALSGALQRYDLPDPIMDPAALRRAWLSSSATMLDRLPDRVVAPLLGHTFRAALGHNEWVLTLVGPPGSYKTSIAAKAMHHFGEQWDHSKPASSMSGNGDTFNALRLKLHLAKDALVWMDDFAPTKSWLEAQRHLEETTRLIHNQEERERNSRDGQDNKPGTPPRASGLCTSEVMPRPGSASERMFVVPLAKDDVDTATLFPLDHPLSRHGRAVLMASYIAWLARDLRMRRTHYETVADQYAQALVNTTGETVRQAYAVANTYIGWVAMLDFLLDVGAVTSDERVGTLRRVHAGLLEACKAAVNPDMPRTTGARVRELLAFALRQGIAYVDDVRSGECPPWPLAGRLGWRRTIISEASEQDSLPARYRLDRGQIRLGYVLHDPGPRERGRLLMCDSTQLEAVLKAAAGTQAERLEIDRATACRALHDEGVLIADESEGRVRHTLKCRIYAEDRTARMVALDLDRVIGDDIDEDSDPVDLGGGPQGSATDGAACDDGQSVLDIPGLAVLDPQRVDGLASVAQAQSAVAVDMADDGTGEVQPNEEFAMSNPLGKDPSRPPALCVECGYPCETVVDALPMHRSCWQLIYGDDPTPTPTTAADARRATVAAPSVETPVLPETTPQATAHPAAPEGGEKFRAAAVVVDVDGIWTSSGKRYVLPEGGPNHVGDLVALSQWVGLGTQVTKYVSAGGQVWVGDELAKRLGIDVDALRAAPDRDKDKVTRAVTKNIPAVTQALAAGYSIGGREGDSLGRWTRIWKGNQKSVWVVLLAAMEKDGDRAIPLLRDDPNHAQLARRIGLLAGALGHPYQLSGSTTGLDLMKALRRKDQQHFFTAHEPVPPALQSNIEVDLSWSRPPDDEERKHEWVHAYDRSGSYLAGVSGLELGVGDPEHHPEGVPFTARTPGYWRIEVPEPGDWRMPNPLDPTGANTGKIRWVTTPGLEFAIEQDYAPEILEAYTWNTRARVFDPWYERIRDARAALDVDDPDSQVARDQLKAIYAPTIGMLGSTIHMTGREGYAPERRHMIIAKARTNILRRVARIGHETGRWPVAIVTDTVLYTSPDPDPIASWPGGDRWFGRDLGRYKHEGSALLASHLQYLTGGRYRGKDSIVRPQHGAE